MSELKPYLAVVEAVSTDLNNANSVLHMGIFLATDEDDARAQVEQVELFDHAYRTHVAPAGQFVRIEIDIP